MSLECRETWWIDAVVQLSTDFKSSKSRNEIAPKSSLSIVLGQATQVYISILKAGHFSDLGQPANILKPHFSLYSVQKVVVMPVTMGLTSVHQSLSHLRAKAMSVAQHLSLALAQTYNCREFCTEGIGNPCHSSSVLSNQFPWNPTYVEPDKLSALWVAFCWCEVPGPIYLKPAWWSESVRLGGFMACLQSAIQSSLRCLIEGKNYRHTANDMRTDQSWQGREQEEPVCYWVLYGGTGSLAEPRGRLSSDRWRRRAIRV